jgi:predicted O-methyltransferase YrrM
LNTLTTPQVAGLLDRLFGEAETSEVALQEVAQSDASRLMTSKTGYRQLYSMMKDIPLPVSRETGTLLYMLTRSTGAKSILEFGTSYGVSTIYLAAGVRDNGGGRILTTEFEPSKAARAREHLTAAGLVDLVEIREGDALETLAQDLPTTLDLVLLDGAKGLYLDILDRIESHLRPGSLVLADDADHCPDYLRRVRGDGETYLSVPFAGDVEVSMRLE